MSTKRKKIQELLDKISYLENELERELWNCSDLKTDLEYCQEENDWLRDELEELRDEPTYAKQDTFHMLFQKYYPDGAFVKYDAARRLLEIDGKWVDLR